MVIQYCIIVMDVIKRIILEDPIARFLLDRSSITHIQLDTYMIDQFGREQGAKLSEKIELRDKGPVKEGAFIRTLRQAQANIKESICTIILAQYLGILDKRTISGLLQIGNMMSLIDKEALTPEQERRILDQLMKITQSSEAKF
jgi:hypothetical protein